MARTTRTLGTLVASAACRFWKALNITRETTGNAVFEQMYGKVSDSIREGETIAKPLRDIFQARLPSGRGVLLGVLRVFPLLIMTTPACSTRSGIYGCWCCSAAVVLGGLYYCMKMNDRIVDDLVVNMVDVGEETGELDTMLYKVADIYDEEVTALTDGLMKLIEPLLIVLPRRCGRLHRHRAVHAADQTDSNVVVNATS